MPPASELGRLRQRLVEDTLKQPADLLKYVKQAVVSGWRAPIKPHVTLVPCLRIGELVYVPSNARVILLYPSIRKPMGHSAEIEWHL